jgi:hypothetical protein
LKREAKVEKNRSPLKRISVMPFRCPSSYNQHDMKPRALPIALLATFMFLFLSSGGVASARQDEDAVAIDTFIARQAHRERGEEYREARKVVVGDLTHDGTPETVVLSTIEGQGGRNFYVQYLAVFTRQKGKL